MSVRRRVRRLLQRQDARRIFAALEDLPRHQRSVVSLLGHPFVVPDGLSFLHNYEEIFQDEIYRFPPRGPRPVIVDCGANIGTTVVYFKSIYPDCRITAVEADPEIFSVLRQNLEVRGLQGVRLINKALYHRKGPVTFHVEGADSGRIHRLEQARRGSIEVEAVLLDELLCEPVDFLKVDVEGAETDALCAARNLELVSSLFVEYHSFADSPQTLSRLLWTLSDQGFRYYIRTQYCPHRPLLKRPDHLGMDLQLNVFATRAVASR